MLIETLKKFYSKEYNLNCSETMLYAANEEYNLNLDKEALKIMAAFGGGMGIEGVCGAITGALGALGVIFVEEKAHESEKIKELSKEFIEEYIKRLGTDNCGELKKKYKNEDIRCWRMIQVSGEILEEMIKRERAV